MDVNVKQSSRRAGTSRDDLSGLLIRLVQRDNNTIDELAGGSLLTPGNIARVLADLAMDPISFTSRYHCTSDDFAREIDTAYQQLKVIQDAGQERYSRLRGVLGFISFTMTALAVVASRENQAPPSSLPAALQDLFDDQNVRGVFYELYRPAGRVGDPAAMKVAELARAHWKNLDLDSLRMHRVGTTSFILTCHVPLLGGEPLALKCLLFPYTQIPAIAEATRSYALDYPSGKTSATVPVHSSTDKWILMDFAAGLTLQELLAREQHQSTSAAAAGIRTGLLASIGPELFEVLRSLHHAGFEHRDLAPSNIIVVNKPDIKKPDGTIEPGAVERLLLIDLGPNYLYTRQGRIAESREALFIAPEVKEDAPAATSDIYSLGMILVELADPRGALDGVIPDSLYRQTPYLARFIEDLIDAKPENRLLIFHPAPGEDVFDTLRSAFADELKLLSVDDRAALSESSWLRNITELLLPSSRQVGHRFHIWRQARSAHAAIDNYSGYLLTWSVISTTAWYLIFAVALLWGLRDVGIDAWSTPVTIIQKVFGSNSSLPVIDKLRAPGYQIQNWRANLQAPILAFSVGLAGTKYYQNILAGLTARAVSGGRAFWTEVFIRYTSFAVLVPALIGNLVQPQWWAWLMAIGYIPPTVTSYLCYSLARRNLRDANAFSTVWTSVDPTLQAYGQWWSSMAFLVLALISLAIGLQLHVIHDVWVYASSLAALNVVIMYGFKSIYFAPSVRGSLTRAFIAGERWEVVRSRKDANA
jgi:serine/threonine protein kinase